MGAAPSLYVRLKGHSWAEMTTRERYSTVFLFTVPFLTLPLYFAARALAGTLSELTAYGSIGILETILFVGIFATIASLAGAFVIERRWTNRMVTFDVLFITIVVYASAATIYDAAVVSLNLQYAIANFASEAVVVGLAAVIALRVAEGYLQTNYRRRTDT